jgi:hypothetical protein
MSDHNERIFHARSYAQLHAVAKELAAKLSAAEERDRWRTVERDGAPEVGEYVEAVRAHRDARIPRSCYRTRSATWHFGDNEWCGDGSILCWRPARPVGELPSAGEGDLAQPANPARDPRLRYAEAPDWCECSGYMAGGFPCPRGKCPTVAARLTMEAKKEEPAGPSDEEPLCDTAQVFEAYQRDLKPPARPWLRLSANERSALTKVWRAGRASLADELAKLQESHERVHREEYAKREVLEAAFAELRQTAQRYSEEREYYRSKYHEQQAELSAKDQRIAELTEELKREQQAATAYLQEGTVVAGKFALAERHVAELEAKNAELEGKVGAWEPCIAEVGRVRTGSSSSVVALDRAFDAIPDALRPKA